MKTEKDYLMASEKYNLTIKEAVQYFNIGEKNLRKLVANNPTADYILMVGNTLQNICSSDTIPIPMVGIVLEFGG